MYKEISCFYICLSIGQIITYISKLCDRILIYLKLKHINKLNDNISLQVELSSVPSNSPLAEKDKHSLAEKDKHSLAEKDKHSLAEKDKH
jgi:hypothetical protein